VVKADRWLITMVMGSNPSTVYLMVVSDNASYYITEKSKIKVAKCGTPKKIKNK
jgi:hypothetical protein